MTVIDLDSRRPHATKRALCLLCGCRWQAVFPEGTEKLQCPLCERYDTQVDPDIVTELRAAIKRFEAADNADNDHLELLLREAAFVIEEFRSRTIA